MRAVNLLPRDDQQQSRKKQNVPALISTALVVLVTGVLGVMYFSAKSESSAAGIELQDAQADLALLPTAADLAAKGAAQRQLATERDQRLSALSSALTHRIAWDRVLRQISLVLPDDVWLTNFSATSPVPAGSAAPPVTPPGAAPTLLSIAGSTYSHEAVARLLTRLSVIPDLKNVWLQQSSRSNVLGRTIVGFTILADIRAGGATS